MVIAIGITYGSVAFIVQTPTEIDPFVPADTSGSEVSHLPRKMHLGAKNVAFIVQSHSIPLK
ncbi:MAG TPA: hypothetical protein V6C97_08485 [Oculatellaceae cyanobacterium]